MLRLARWRLGVLATLCACGSPIPMPKVPVAQTDAGRQRVQNCQALYNACVVGAIGAVGGLATPSRAESTACREQLGACYGTCPP